MTEPKIQNAYLQVKDNTSNPRKSLPPQKNVVFGYKPNANSYRFSHRELFLILLTMDILETPDFMSSQEGSKTD